MIEGISHVTFIVSDIGRMTRFLSQVFDAEEIYKSGNKTFSLSKEKFFLIGGVWVAIMEGESSTEKNYNHIAFKISEDQFDFYERRLCSLGIKILGGRDRVEGEGRSIYFYDHDNHLFELHTGTLQERLNRYKSRDYKENQS